MWGCCIHWVGYALDFMVCTCTLNLVNFLGPLTLNAKLKGQKVILKESLCQLSVFCLLLTTQTIVKIEFYRTHTPELCQWNHD